MDAERRLLLRLLAASILSVPLAGSCRHEEPPTTATPLPPGDPCETLKLRGYRGLAELPYFEPDSRGNLRLTVDDLPPAIDFHTHLAFNFLLSPKVDLLRRTERTRYLIDCDGARPVCLFDLDVYINRIATDAMLEQMESEVRGMLLFGSDAARTHTIPNLLSEMDTLGFAQAVALAVAPGLPFRDDATQWWAESIRQAGAQDRLILYGSVPPTRSSAVDDLRGLMSLGIRGLKLHPTMQRFYPDDPAAMRLYEACADLGLPVFFHAGRAGIEPEFTRKYAVMKHYIAPVAEFPQVRFVFGHAGARDHRDALPIARAHRNVWMDVHGQGVTALRQMIKDLGPERLVFGSDWPWYPLAATLAKVLIATEGDRRVRDMILSENARRFLSPS